MTSRSSQPVVMDLFAGCGGLSLGLEFAGFRPVFVNEIHPSARTTYLGNRRESEWLQRHENQSADILDLTRPHGELEALASRFRRQFGDVDLIAGGPPCQGFSGIGHRRSFSIARNEVPGNHLYREMARIVSAVGPRAFLFENVKGLLASRWTPDGEKGEIWADVQSTFEGIRVKKGRSEIGYCVFAGLVHAKNFGVPQNRPRVILIGIREDVCRTSDAEAELSPIFDPKAEWNAPDLIELLDDLADPRWQSGPTLSYPRSPKNALQESFRRSKDGKHVLGRGAEVMDQEYSRHRPEVVAKFEYMLANDGQIPIAMQTKKFAQRVLPRRWSTNGPSITATSLPDDYVHYSLPRTPSVREWARIQTFPDWYSFAGRRTTGGRRRAGDPGAGIWDRDVPKYTQIGNAVPVEMAKAIGELVRRIVQ